MTLRLASSAGLLIFLATRLSGKGMVSRWVAYSKEGCLLEEETFLFGKIPVESQQLLRGTLPSGLFVEDDAARSRSRTERSSFRSIPRHTEPYVQELAGWQRAVRPQLPGWTPTRYSSKE